jgi:hypothetical protein
VRLRQRPAAGGHRIFERVDGPVALPLMANAGAVIETESKEPFDYAGFEKLQNEMFGLAASRNTGNGEDRRTDGNLKP